MVAVRNSPVPVRECLMGNQILGKSAVECGVEAMMRI